MRFVWHDGHWYPVASHPIIPPIAPYIIRDHMEPAQHPCTGELFDSKSAFRAITKAHGCVELGNDAAAAIPVRGPDPTLRQDIATAMQMVEQGHRPEPAERVTGEVRKYE